MNMGFGVVLKNILRSCVRKMNYKLSGRLLRLSNFIREIILSNDSIYYGQVHKRMNVDSILSKSYSICKNANENDLFDCSENYLGKNNGRKKVRIVYPSGTSWNSIGSICDAIFNDDCYDMLVLVENYPRYVNIVREHKTRYCLLDKYDLKNDKPDLLIATSYSSSPKQISFEGCRDYIKLLISAFPNVVVNEPSIEYHWSLVNKAYRFFQPDYYIFDKLLLHSAYGYISKNRIVEIGNPQFDDLFKKMNSSFEYPNQWNKLKNKKVFLWATDHGLRDDNRIEGTSVDLYISELIHFFEKKKDIGLIIRFHPFLIRELTTGSFFWSYSDFQKLKAFCMNSQNIVWDESTDYSISFNISDALLVDVNCSFIISYLVTGKPICRLMRNDCPVHLIHEELKDSYDYAYDFSQCVDFIERVIEEKDTKKEAREAAFKESIMYYDGNNGKRIKKFIDDTLK